MTKTMLAILKPDPNSVAAFGSALARLQQHGREFGSLDELVAEGENAAERFDAIVIPLRLGDLSSGITTCLQLRANDAFLLVPILGISPSPDKALIQSFFRAGADVVLAGAIDADILVLQAESLARRKRFYEGERHRQHEELLRLRDSTAEAFHTVRDGLLLLSSAGDVVFINHAARTALGVAGDAHAEVPAVIGRQLADLIAKHRSELLPAAATASRRADGLLVALSRVDGQQFFATLRVCPLRGGDAGSSVGYVVSFEDFSALREVSELVEQERRYQNLVLVLAATVLKLMDAPDLGSPNDPLGRLRAVLKKDEGDASISNVMTSLTELLDLIVPDGVRLKVALPPNLRVAITSTALYRLFGLTLFRILRLTGPDVELAVTLRSDQRPGSVAIEVRATSQRSVSISDDDPLLRALLGEMHQSAQRRSGSIAELNSLEADMFQTATPWHVLEERLSPHELRTVVILPAVP